MILNCLIVHQIHLRSSESLKTVDVEFKQKYRERLSEVIEKLGLQEFEDLPLELRDETNFEEFSHEFHSRMLRENCGMSQTTGLEKLMVRKLPLGQTRIFDPINLVSRWNSFYLSILSKARVFT